MQISIRHQNLYANINNYNSYKKEKKAYFTIDNRNYNDLKKKILKTFLHHNISKLCLKTLVL